MSWTELRRRRRRRRRHKDSPRLCFSFSVEWIARGKTGLSSGVIGSTARETLSSDRKNLQFGVRCRRVSSVALATCPEQAPPPRSEPFPWQRGPGGRTWWSPLLMGGNGERFFYWVVKTCSDLGCIILQTSCLFKIYFFIFFMFWFLSHVIKKCHVHFKSYQVSTVVNYFFTVINCFIWTLQICVVLLN